MVIVDGYNPFSIWLDIAQSDIWETPIPITNVFKLLIEPENIVLNETPSGAVPTIIVCNLPVSNISK